MADNLYSLNQIILNYAGNYGTNCKNITSAILELDNNFSLYSVITDTTSVYSARLRFLDSNIFLHVFNSSYNLSIAIETLIGDTWNTLSTATGNYNNSAEKHAITVSKIGDFIGTITLMPNYYYQGRYSGVRLRYGVASAASLNNSKVFFYLCENCNIYNESSSNPTYPFYSLSQQYSILDDTSVNAIPYNTYELISSTVPVNLTYGYQQILESTASPNLLSPLYIYAYSSNFYTGELKWGNLYHIYVLYDSDGAVLVTPNYKYTIMDTTITPGFTRLYIPRLS